MEPLTNTCYQHYNCNAIRITIVIGVSCIIDYKRMYAIMFRAAELAVRYIESGEAENAVFALQTAQLVCENIYIESDDGTENT